MVAIEGDDFEGRLCGRTRAPDQRRAQRGIVGVGVRNMSEAPGLRRLIFVDRIESCDILEAQELNTVNFDYAAREGAGDIFSRLSPRLVRIELDRRGAETDNRRNARVERAKNAGQMLDIRPDTGEIPSQILEADQNQVHAALIARKYAVCVQQRLLDLVILREADLEFEIQPLTPKGDYPLERFGGEGGGNAKTENFICRTMVRVRA